MGQQLLIIYNKDGEEEKDGEYAEQVLMIESGSKFCVVDVSTLSVRKVVPGFELSKIGKELFVYSSNGVLLLVDGRNERMVLWNPATGKYKHIIDPPDSDSDSDNNSCFYGLWYDSCNEFRILRIRHEQKVSVFDSNSNSWKTVDALPHNTYVGAGQLDSKAFIHGGFHVAALDSDEQRKRILSLSPEGKVIRDFRPPSELSLFLTTKMWEGRLCLQALAWIWTLASDSFEYWNMEEYGKSESWKKVATLESPADYVLRSLHQNGRQLWHQYSDDMKDVVMNQLFVKDGDEMKSIISSSSESMSFVGTYTYTPTLLSP